MRSVGGGVRVNKFFNISYSDYMDIFGATQKGMDEKTDEEILQISGKNPHVFAILVSRYESALLRKAKRLVKSREAAEDVVQETFTKVYIYANQFKSMEGASFKSWLYKILINTAYTEYQKKKRRGTVVSIDDGVADMVADPTSLFGDIELRDRVAMTLSRIPDSLSCILTEYFIEDKPQKQIAQKEGVSLSAIKTRLHRAKKKFKEVESSLDSITS